MLIYIKKIGVSVMNDIKIGQLYMYKDNGNTPLTGDQVVEVVDDTRGSIGGGIVVLSKETGTQANVDRAQLHQYTPPPPVWKKYRDQFFLGFTNKAGLFIAAGIGMLLRPYLEKILQWLSNIFQVK